jgi:hypothetical protein
MAGLLYHISVTSSGSERHVQAEQYSEEIDYSYAKIDNYQLYSSTTS